METAKPSPLADKRTNGSRSWIFQANPDRYRIHESLRRENEEWWNLNQHATKVAAGDRVLIWICGNRAGIYALGTVTSEPVKTADSLVGQNYWLDPVSGTRVKARVRVRYDQVLLDRPLLKPYLEADPSLWNLQILRSPRGTNFQVSAEEWLAIQEWINDGATEPS